MSKAKDINLSHNFCKCGQFLYSENNKRIKVARTNQVIYFFNKEIEIKCSKCNEATIIKVEKCMD